MWHEIAVGLLTALWALLMAGAGLCVIPAGTGEDE